MEDYDKYGNPIWDGFRKFENDDDLLSFEDLPYTNKEAILEALDKWWSPQRARVSIDSIQVKALLTGWVVLDDSGESWFFPGLDNKPEKKDNEWIGFSPIHINIGPLAKDEQDMLKKVPKIIKLET